MYMYRTNYLAFCFIVSRLNKKEQNTVMNLYKLREFLLIYVFLRIFLLSSSGLTHTQKTS